MIHGYHVIWGTYGFWLPNDPQGSWSDFINSWELLRFGRAKKQIVRDSFDDKSLSNWKSSVREKLKYPSVTLSGIQALEVARGLSGFIRRSHLTVWAMSILPDHLHLVLGRHRYKIEIACNLLKGAATRRLVESNEHPLAAYRQRDGRLPSMWSSKQWIQYLDSEDAIYNAIRYVEENPVKEGKRKQSWSCVSPFEGISQDGWFNYY